MAETTVRRRVRHISRTDRVRPQERRRRPPARPRPQGQRRVAPGTEPSPHAGAGRAHAHAPAPASTSKWSIRASPRDLGERRRPWSAASCAAPRRAPTSTERNEKPV